MGSGPSTRVCHLNHRQQNNNNSTWSFMSIATDGLCPRQRDNDSPLRSIDRRPEHQKKEDREKIVQRAITAEGRVKEMESRMKDLEKKMHDLTISNTEMRNELSWAKENTTNANTLDYGFIHHSITESIVQLNEKDLEIEKLNKKLIETQEALDRIGASEAVKDLKIVEQQREIDSLQLRITSLEEICRNRMDDDSLVSVSPTYEHILAPETKIIIPSYSPNMNATEQPRKSNIRSNSAQVRRLSSNLATSSHRARAVSTQPEHIRKNIVMIERPMAHRMTEGRSTDSDADIQEILNTDIRASPSASSHKRDSDVSLPRPRRLAFQ